MVDRYECGNDVAMESNMVEENGNSSLDQLGGESASVHNNTDDNSTHQSQLSSSLHHQQQQQQQDASPSGAILASSANIVQFIPTQSVQVNCQSYQSVVRIFLLRVLVSVCIEIDKMKYSSERLHYK